MTYQANHLQLLSGSDKMSKSKYFWIDAFMNIADFVAIGVVIYFCIREDISWWILIIGITYIIGQNFVRNYLGINIYAPKLSKRLRK